MEKENDLAVKPIKSLVLSFALPSIIALLVNSLYNIVDQIFIGNYSGFLGNAASSVPFPMFMFGMALASCISEGGAAYFSLQLGAGHKKIAEKIVGNVILLLGSVSVVYALILTLFLPQLLSLFGATKEILPLSLEYSYIMLFAMPFMLCGMGLNALVRADGSPRYAMVSMLSGAAVNLILDPIFIFVFDWGISGAAWATFIATFVSFVISFLYLFRFKFLKLSFKSLKFSFPIVRKTILYGISNFIVSSAVTFMVILNNNGLKTLGAQSIYGSNIPLSAYALTAKINQILMAFLIGIGVSLQPIVGFNYGARNYMRVKETFRYCIWAGVIVGFIFMSVVEVFPYFFVRLFGHGSELYYEFAIFCFRVVLLSPVFLSICVISSNFFRAIGKPWMAVFVAGARFTVFLFPTMYILFRFTNVKGFLFTSVITDSLGAMFSLWLIKQEMKKLNRLIKDEKKRKKIV